MRKRLPHHPVSDPPTAETPTPPKGLSSYMAALGKKGGTISGARRRQNLTPKQRSASARKAARARWAAMPSKKL